MTPDEFRTAGHELIEWIIDYLGTLEEQPVQPTVRPGEVRAALPSDPPARREPFAHLIADLEILRPGLTGWQSPSFFAYFPANTSFPAILGDLLSSGLGQNGMLWATSPAATEVECLMCDWMVDLLGLPSRFRFDGGGGGVIQDSASSATLCAVLAARERSSESNRTGVRRPLTVYATDQAHSSIRKAVRIAGLGDDHLRVVPCDHRFAMDHLALATMIAADRAAGLEPCMVIATVGTTSTLAVDPVAEIARVCRSEGLWLHVDAAMAGIAALCPEMRWVNDGLDGADSYLTNPHKWMGVTFDCTLLWVADRTSLPHALGIAPAYLRTAHDDVVDYRDWQIPLGRRFRALKLWFAVRLIGPDEIAERIRRDVENAERLAALVGGHPGFEIVAPPVLGLVCFRVTGTGTAESDDRATEALVDRANSSGSMLLTLTELHDRPAIRFSIGAMATQWRHVEAAWEFLSAPR